MVTATCEGCGTTFEAKTARRKWCTDACKVRTQRARRSQSEQSQAEQPAGTAEGAPTRGLKPEDPLVTAVRLELTKADAVDTVDGQIALHLAAQVKVATGSSAASLATKLREVLDRITPPAPPAPTEPDDGPPEPDDPATEARKARQAKLAAAAAAAAEAES